VLGDLARQGPVVRDALEAVPETVGPWDALRDAFNAVKVFDDDPELTLKISRMMYETPTLRARSIEKHLHWQSLLVPNIRQRLGIDRDDETNPSADAIVASAIACLDVAGEVWTRSGGTLDLAALYEQAALAVRG